MADTSRPFEDEIVPREGALDLEVNDKVTLVKAEDEEQKPVLEKQETASEAEKKEALTSKPRALSDEQTVLSDEEEAVEYGEVALSEEKKAFEVVKAAFEAEKAAFMTEKSLRAPRQTADCATKTDEVEVKVLLPKRKAELTLEAMDEPNAKRQRLINDILAAELEKGASSKRSTSPEHRLGCDLGYTWSQVAQHVREPDSAYELPLPGYVGVQRPEPTPSPASDVPAAQVPAGADLTKDDEYTGQTRIPARNRKRLSRSEISELCQFIFVKVAGRRRYFTALSKEVQDRILQDVYAFYRKSNFKGFLRILESPLQSASTKKVHCAGCRAHALMLDVKIKGPACGRCQAGKRLSIRVTDDGSADPELVPLPEEKRAGLGPEDLGYYVVR
ncbi:hypothetical protein LTR56_011922 [Elasticomyces elasticus]|nr:hypothetical protein LTR56_011922 [Elasticomyces elasticus]KAK3654810.1 hypothetical protein LTR22_010576 [Elasticomyces elasticus]KAK4920622.1 hypothetical protein LTR49_011869 [Elasticomyces elasticus]KAK5759351.1 hypothetical protein LTS12_010516 [Elasticomyces elasticus]